MNKEKKDLIRKIIKKTKSGEIRWGMHTSAGGSYFCSENNGVELMMREFVEWRQGVCLAITTEEESRIVDDECLGELHNFLLAQLRKGIEKER